MSSSNEKVNLQESFFKQLTKFKVRKGLISLQDSYQHQLVLVNARMYDQFHVPNVLIVLL